MQDDRKLAEHFAGVALGTDDLLLTVDELREFNAPPEQYEQGAAGFALMNDVLAGLQSKVGARFREVVEFFISESGECRNGAQLVNSKHRPLQFGLRHQSRLRDESCAARDSKQQGRRSQA